MKSALQARSIFGMILLSAVLLGMTSLVWKWTDKGRKRDRLLSDRLETLETKVKMFETEIAELKGMPRQVSSTGGASTSASGAAPTGSVLMNCKSGILKSCIA
eukprot:432745-Rhodomonas_salina.2